MTQPGSDALPTRRPAPLLLAGAAVAISALLMLLAHAGDVPLLLGTATLQVLLLLGFLALVDAPAGTAVFLLAAGAALAADLRLVAGEGAGPAGDLAGVTALGLVAALLVQLLRRPRTRVTEALADSVVALLLVTSAAALLAAVHGPYGEAVVRTGLLAAGTALLVGRLADHLAPAAPVAPEATRGWPGFALGLLAGALLAVPEGGELLTTRQSLLVGLACAGAAALADLFVDLAATEVVRSSDEERRLQALRPVTALLPFALLGPVVLLAVRLLERS